MNTYTLYAYLGLDKVNTYLDRAHSWLEIANSYLERADICRLGACARGFMSVYGVF